MRLVLPSLVALLAALPAAQAQSISQNLPQYTSDTGSGSVYVAPDGGDVPAVPAPATASVEQYTVIDVNADVTADNAAHARDQALMQAERAAFVQLCARLNIPDSAVKTLNDDAVAALVQSFEVQSEHLSAVRYIGVFTIRFSPAAVQRKLGRYAGAVDAGGNPAGEDARSITGPVAHLPLAVQTESLAVWAQIKRRLSAVPQIARIQVIDLGRGTSHIDLLYGGSVEDLQQAVNAQGFVLRPNAAGGWDLTDGSMVPR